MLAHIHSPAKPINPVADPQQGLCAVYWYLFFASRILPGVPSWEAPPEQYKEILNESINFWYCNNAFEAAGWPHIPNEAVRLLCRSVPCPLHHATLPFISHAHTRSLVF